MNTVCAHIQDRLIEQQLTGQAGLDHAAIQTHVEACPGCRLFQEQLRRDHERLTEYARSVEPLVTGLRQRVADRLGSATQKARRLPQRTNAAYAGIAAGILAMLAVWAVFHGHQTSPLPEEGLQPDLRTAASKQSTGMIPGPQDQVPDQVKVLFAKQDVGGLMDLLDTGPVLTQQLVAGYLAELGAVQATPSLARLAAAWTGDPGANPFAQALAHMDAVTASSHEPNGPAVGQASELTAAASTRPGLRVRVVDRVSGQPLQGARISDEPDQGEYTCDTNGYCEISLASVNRGWPHIVASRPGYVGMCMQFGDPRELTLSRTYVFPLGPAVVIGGTVQDAHGAPIEGALVSFSIHGDHGSARPDNSSVTPILCIQFKERTDTAGRWLCDTVPPDMLNLAEDCGYTLGVEHSDYASQWYSVRDAATVIAMRSQTFETTLYEGSVFRARVVNTRHQPIAGAEVFAGKAYVTGQGGTFVLEHIHPGTTQINLSVEATGYPKVYRAVDYVPNIAEAEIVIEDGWTAHGRVTDSRGSPVAEAEIEIDSGANQYRLGNSDPEGRFSIGPVAADARSVWVRKSGFQPGFQELKGPTDLSLEFVLRRIFLPASGSVRDAATGRPIEQFRVMPGIVSPAGKVFFDPARAICYPGKAGHYECPFNLLFSGEAGISYVVIAEASGYLPALSRIINQDEGAAVIDLTMTPGTGPGGTVLDANGLPAAGALVYASPENEGDRPTYNGTGLMSLYANSRTRTSAAGRFSFEPMFQVQNLVAMTEQGIAGVPVSELAQTRRLAIQPWAEVQGTLRCGNAIMPATTVRIRSVPEAAAQCGYKWELSARTDSQGTFQIKRVPPGGFQWLDKTYQVAPNQVLRLDLIMDPNSPVNP